MAQVEIKAGAKFDILTEPELRAHTAGLVAGWMTEIARGIKFRRAAGQTNVAAGVWSIGDPEDKQDTLAPRPGFLWSVTNIAVAGNGYKLGTDTFGVNLGQVSSLTTVATGILRDRQWSPGALVVNPTDTISVSGVGTAAGPGTDVAVTLLVIEVPIQLAWQLL